MQKAYKQLLSYSVYATQGWAILLSPAPDNEKYFKTIRRLTLNIKITVQLISFTLTPERIIPIYNQFSSLTVPTYFFQSIYTFGAVYGAIVPKKKSRIYLST